MTIKNKIYLSVAVFTALTILIVIFVIYPFLRGIKNNSEELISQKAELNTLEAKIANLKKFDILYKDLEEILEKIDNLFINSEVPVEFISFLETTSLNYFLSTEISATPPQEIGKDPWSSLTFQLSSTGSFPNFLKFLEKLKASPYLIEIQNLNVSRATENGVKANLSIKVFSK